MLFECVVLLLLVATAIGVVLYTTQPLSDATQAWRQEDGFWIVRLQNGKEYVGHPVVSGWRRWPSGKKVWLLHELRLQAHVRQLENERWEKALGRMKRVMLEALRRERESQHGETGKEPNGEAE